MKDILNNNDDTKIYSKNDLKKIILNFIQKQKPNPADPNNFYSKGVEDLADTILNHELYEKALNALQKINASVNVARSMDDIVMIWIQSNTNETLTPEEKDIIQQFYNKRYNASTAIYYK